MKSILTVDCLTKQREKKPESASGSGRLMTRVAKGGWMMKQLCYLFVWRYLSTLFPQVLTLSMRKEQNGRWVNMVSGVGLNITGWSGLLFFWTGLCHTEIMRILCGPLGSQATPVQNRTEHWQTLEVNCIYVWVDWKQCFFYGFNQNFLFFQINP